MIRVRHALLAAIVAAAVAIAFGSVARAAAQAAAGQDRQVTFSEDVAPILFDNCTSCHRPGQTQSVLTIVRWNTARDLPSRTSGQECRNARSG